MQNNSRGKHAVSPRKSRFANGPGFIRKLSMIICVIERGFDQCMRSNPVGASELFNFLDPRS